MKRKLTVIAIGALLVGGSAWCLRVATAKTCQVTSGALHETVVATGQVVPAAGIANVFARVDGRVTRVYVREGDHVKAGQLLAEIDSAEALAVVARLEAERRAFAATASMVSQGARTQERVAAEAALTRSMANLAVAQDQLERAKKLHESGSESDRTLIEAQGAADVAKATVDEARARRDLTVAGGRDGDVAAARDRVTAAGASLDEAKRRLDRTRILAPMDGVVLARRVDEGDTVNESSSALFDLADLEKTEISLEIEEPDALRAAEGMELTVTMPGGREPLGTGRITRLGARVQKRAIGADDARLRADTLVRSAWATYSGVPLPLGKRVEAVIHLPERAVAALVPRSAVHVHDGLATVDVVAGPMLERRTVRLGAADSAFVEVDGLQAGTRLVLAAGDKP
jgi:multidrug efflux pump subunit AcrA (membrane-fusion protein)